MTMMCSRYRGAAARGSAAADGDPLDVALGRPLRIGVALCGQVFWDSDAAAERIRGVDLRDVARQSAHVRHDHPDVDVVADIEVIIADEARTALAMLNFYAGETGGSTLRYVGTPSGLAGLVSDIHALGIADGAVLIPRTVGVADLIRDAVLPALRTTLRLPASTREARPA